MPAPTVTLFEVPISRLGLEPTLKACQDRQRERAGGYVCFTNVHTLTESTSDSHLKRVLQGAFLATADGLPLVWASNWFGKPVESRVCGPDFIAEWAKLQSDAPCGLIGGAPGRAQRMASTLGFKTAYCYSPPMRPFSETNVREDWAEFLKLCPDGKAPTTVWVGLGAPKQEYWMQAASLLAPETLFFGVGAAFDFHSGAIQRAPRWMQRSGLEWAYRLSQDPRRLWRRYATTNLRFMGLMAKSWLSSRSL